MFCFSKVTLGRKKTQQTKQQSEPSVSNAVATNIVALSKGNKSMKVHLMI